MKQIILTESQLYKLVNNRLIQEGQGVNYDMLQVAKAIANDIIENHMMDIFEEYQSEEEDWRYSQEEYDEDDNEFGFYSDFDEDENPWYNLEENYYLRYNNEIYWYELFYSDRNHRQNGEASNNSIEINFYPIKQKLLQCQEEGLSLYDPKSQNYINSLVKNTIYPVILHELTHTLKKDRGDLDEVGWWLKVQPNRLVPEEDVRECRYLFTPNEMNARIGSVGALMEEALEELFMTGIDDLEELSHSWTEFKDFVDNYVISDEIGKEELKIDSMQLYLKEMAHYNNFDMKIRPDYLKFSNGRPMSFAYYIFLNDNRIRKNRNIKQLFQTNFNAGEKAVYKFYQGLYDEYIKKIYRACYGTLTNYIERLKQQ